MIAYILGIAVLLVIIFVVFVGENSWVQKSIGVADPLKDKTDINEVVVSTDPFYADDAALSRYVTAAKDAYLRVVSRNSDSCSILRSMDRTGFSANFERISSRSHLITITSSSSSSEIPPSRRVDAGATPFCRITFTISEDKKSATIGNVRSFEKEDYAFLTGNAAVSGSVLKIDPSFFFRISPGTGTRYCIAAFDGSQVSSSFTLEEARPLANTALQNYGDYKGGACEEN